MDNISSFVCTPSMPSTEDLPWRYQGQFSRRPFALIDFLIDSIVLLFSSIAGKHSDNFVELDFAIRFCFVQTDLFARR